MKNADTFAVVEQWTERRTASGRWSTVIEDHHIRRYNRAEFDAFLAERWPGEPRRYSSSRVVEPHPSGEYRSVTELTVRDQYGFIDLLIEYLE